MGIVSIPFTVSSALSVSPTGSTGSNRLHRFYEGPFNLADPHFGSLFSSKKKNKKWVLAGG